MYTIRIIAVVIAIMFTICFDWYSVFRKDDIWISDLLSLGHKVYKYTDIRDIRDVEKLKAPNGKIVEDEHYIIFFNDGEKWNSRHSGFEDYDEDSKIIELIQEKTGKEVTELEFDYEDR